MRGPVAILAGMALLTACAGQMGSARAPAEVWLLMGQSNMSGRGDLADLPAALHRPDPRIRLFGNDGRVRPAMEPLDAAEGQIDAVSADRIAAVGPGLAFARARARLDPSRRLVLVPCAKGGSAIAAWAPSTDRSTLYGSCLARARQAAQLGRLTGVLWYQGESDARTPELAQAWRAGFQAFVTAIRIDLGRPDLPVVVVSLGDRIVAPGERRPLGWDRVQADQRALSDPFLRIVPAAGLPLKPDGLHLATAAQMALGQRLAEAAETLAPQPERIENDSY